MDSDIVAPVLIADDGELREVRQVLDALDVPYTEIGREAPTDPRVLISNLRYAVGGVADAGDSARVRGRFHIVVAEKLSRTMQQRMQRVCPDFLLERPVDSSSLRLLVLHALYSGPERRRSDRVPMSVVVRYRTQLVTRKANLVDLSQSGCRLLSRRGLKRDECLSVRLPRELSGGRGLQLSGRVVAVEAVEEDPGMRAASVAFTGLDPETRRRLRRVMAEHGIGAGALRPHTTPPSESAPEPHRAPLAAPSGASERRGQPRVLFERSVLAAGRGGSRVLIGRDLSSGGMRVAPDPHLFLGDAFNLVIHGPGGRRPIVVRAIVARDDAEEGCMLRFENLSATGKNTLEEIVTALPALSGEPHASPNVVVSEVVGLGQD